MALIKEGKCKYFNEEGIKMLNKREESLLLTVAQKNSTKKGGSGMQKVF